MDLSRKPVDSLGGPATEREISVCNVFFSRVPRWNVTVTKCVGVYRSDILRLRLARNPTRTVKRS
jgi:hypothetical protein